MENNNQADSASQAGAVEKPAEALPFAYFVQPSSFGPFIECSAEQVGAFPAYRAAPMAVQAVAPVRDAALEEAADICAKTLEKYHAQRRSQRLRCSIRNQE